MPIYEYVCQACNRHIEVLQKVSDAPLTVCTHCGESALRKKVSAAAFRLKGGGWYETDFKTGDKKKNLAGAGESGEKKTGADSGKSGDSGSGGTGGKSEGGSAKSGDAGKKAADKGGA